MNTQILFAIYAALVIVNAVLFVSCIREAMDCVEQIVLFDGDNNPIASATPVFPLKGLLLNTIVFLIPVLHLGSIFTMLEEDARFGFVEMLIEDIGFAVDCEELEEEEQS